jgi:hypothetical protein
MSYPSLSTVQKLAILSAFVLFAKPALAQERDHDRDEHRGRGRHGEHSRVLRRDDDEDDDDEFDNEHEDDDDDDEDEGRGVRGGRQCVDINGDGICDVGNSRAASRTRSARRNRGIRNSDVISRGRSSSVPSHIALVSLLRQLGLR